MTEIEGFVYPAEENDVEEKLEKKKGLSPFAFVKSISQDKTYDFSDEVIKKDYSPLIAMRALSYFEDTTILANIANSYPFLPKIAHFKLLFHGVLKRNRFSKWEKEDDWEKRKIDIIKKYFHYNTQKANDVVSFFSEKEIIDMIELLGENDETP